MLNLGISTSSKNCSVCILKNNKIIARKDVITNNGHSVILVPMIQELFFNSNLNIKDIDQISIDLGPGSFTGIRIGLATAKGIAISNNIPIYGLTSLDSYFANFYYDLYNLNSIIQDRENLEYIITSIFGKNNQVYYKIFKISKKTFFQSIDFGVVQKDIYSDIESLKKQLKNLNINSSNSLIIGENVGIFENNDFKKFESILNSSNIAKFIKDFNDKAIKNPRPIYLKKVQAQIDLENKLKNKN